MATPKIGGTTNDLNSFRRTWHPTTGFHCWGHVFRRKHCQCQAEFLDSPMAASVVRSVNVGQDDPDTKEFTRISFQKTDVTLQGGRCPADQPSNVTAVGRPHVSTPEAFSKAATPIYIFITNSKIALFCYVSIFRFGLFSEV